MAAINPEIVGKFLSTLPEDDDHPYRTGPWRPQTTEWDADDLTVQLYRSGPEFVPREPRATMSGLPVGDPIDVPWRWKRSSQVIRVPIGDVDSGFYFAQLTAGDGRIGFAPFVVRPRILGADARVAGDRGCPSRRFRPMLEILEAVDGPIRGQAPLTDEGNGALNTKLETICKQSADQVRKHLEKVRVSDLLGKK